MTKHRGPPTMAETPITATFTREELALITAELAEAAKRWHTLAEDTQQSHLAKYAITQAHRRATLADRLAKELNHEEGLDPKDHPTP